MSSSESHVFALTVQVSDPLVVAELYDGRGALLWRGTGSATHQLKRGMYQVRAIIGTRVRDEMVRLTEPRVVVVRGPEYETAAPIAGTSSSREYYSGPAKHWSARCTNAGSPPGSWPNLFVFLRALGREEAKFGDPGADVTLRSAHGPTIRLWDRNFVQTDTSDGWTALSLQVPHGSYRLVVGGREHRVLPVEVFHGWCTQVFVPVAEMPRVAEARIFLSQVGHPFEASDAVVRDVDLAIEALRDARNLPRALTERLLEEKFENPMLGLVGAHLLLQAQVAGSPEYARRSLPVESVIDVLRSQLGACADVRALEVRAAMARGAPPPLSMVLKEPPMLRAGFQALQAWASTNDDLTDDAFLESAALVRGDSAWTTWDDSAGLLFPTGSPAGESLNWVDVAVLQAKVTDLPNDVRPTASAENVAANLGLSRRLVRRAWDKVERLSSQAGSAERLFHSTVANTRRER